MVLVPTITLLGGILMPMIGLGTWLMVGDSAENAVDVALEAGYRHIDTAYIYENEVAVGRALKKWFDSGKLKREDIFITTKLPIQGIHVDRVEFFLKKSLKNLGLDYVDLYLVHFPVGIKYVSDELPSYNATVTLETSDHVELWKKMEEQVDAGRARTIGLSNFNESQIERILKSARIRPAALEVEVHVMFAQKKLVNFAQKNEMVVIGYSPLGNPGYNTMLTQLGMKPKKLPDLLGNGVVKKIAKKHNKTPAEILIRFLLERNIVTIPKSASPNRIRSNFEVFNFSLDARDMRKLYGLEKGEKARVMDAQFLPFLQDSPEWPWAEQLKS